MCHCIRKKPKLIGIDLEQTLWPFWLYNEVKPPFFKNEAGEVLDAKNRRVEPFPEACAVLRHLQHQGYVVAAVSRTCLVDDANHLLQLLDWNKYFTYKEICPGTKIEHFKRLKQTTGIDFCEMMLFDDELRNKRDLVTIGVFQVMAEGGLTMEKVQKGLHEFSNQ